MATGQAAYILRNLRRLTTGKDLDGVTDADLPRRYSHERNEASFAALVQRHGPMVWNACARVLPSPHDAEDAFQAARSWSWRAKRRGPGRIRWRAGCTQWRIGWRWA